MEIFLGPVIHSIKVTFLKGVGWGVRLFANGELSQEYVAKTRTEIGPLARSMLRMEDKCGNISDYAAKSRFRPGLKENSRKKEVK
jgi:hypothetical protein